jgi:hypothetical protein
MDADQVDAHIEPVIAKTLNWLDKVVIEQQFCPFARPVREKGQIHIAVQQHTDIASLLRQVLVECDYLLEQRNIETSLLVYTEMLDDFNDYLDFVDLANDAIETAGLEGVLQLASFHPDYVFAGAPEDCASNFTNRSPYPMIHIIQEQSISDALESFKHADAIPERNIAHAKALGIDFFLQHLPTRSNANNKS